jgi:sulfotransferase
MSIKSFDQFVCLAGMPRSGSTVLAAILSQNPQIHTEGNSPMCQMMWDTYLSYQDRCSREFASNGKDTMLPKIIGQIPHTYYSDISWANTDPVNLPELTNNPNTNKKIVVDRCRSWMNDCNLRMLRSAVDPQIKVIVMDRPLQDVMESYARLFSANHMGTALDQVMPQLMGPGTEPVMRAWELIQNIKKALEETQPGEDNTNEDKTKEEEENKSEEDKTKQEENKNKRETHDLLQNTFCFVTYDELVDRPKETMERIYKHCGWPAFDHDFDHVIMKNPEDEKVHGLVGQYTVRPKLERKQYNGIDEVKLPESVLEKIWEIEGKVQINI